MADVSIILVNYNTKEITINCINSIYEKTKDVVFDIWVVDNNSNDGSVEMIETNFPDINIIKNSENIGFARANNLAIEKSNSKYVFFLNTDTILMNNAIKILVDFLESTPSAAACGGALFNENGDFTYSFGELPKLKKYIFNRLGLGFLNPPKMVDRKKTQIVEHIIGADLMVKREILNEVGIFNPDFFLYNEELELQYRINAKGYKIYFVPDAEIIHLEGKSSKDPLLKREQMRKGEYLYFRLTEKNTHSILLNLLLKLLKLLD